MTTPDVIDLWFNRDLRDDLWCVARRLTHRPRMQEKLIGHAWFILGEADAQKTLEYYRKLCETCMYKERDRYRYGEKRL